MTPKRQLLVYAQSEHRVSELRCLLNIRGPFLVCGTERASLACDWLRGEIEFDALVIDGPHDQVLENVASIRVGLPVIWVAPVEQAGRMKPEIVSYVVPTHPGSASVLVEAIKIACVKKRGPKFAKQLLHPLWSPTMEPKGAIA